MCRRRPRSQGSHSARRRWLRQFLGQVTNLDTHFAKTLLTEPKRLGNTTKLGLSRYSYRATYASFTAAPAGSCVLTMLPAALCELTAEAWSPAPLHQAPLPLCSVLTGPALHGSPGCLRDWSAQHTRCSASPGVTEPGCCVGSPVLRRARKDKVKVLAALSAVRRRAPQVSLSVLAEPSWYPAGPVLTVRRDSKARPEDDAVCRRDALLSGGRARTTAATQTWVWLESVNS